MTTDQANAAVLAAIRGDEDAAEGIDPDVYERIRADVDEAMANGYELQPIEEWSGGAEALK
jgi:hypothetical protein